MSRSRKFQTTVFFLAVSGAVFFVRCAKSESTTDAVAPKAYIPPSKTQAASTRGTLWARGGGWEDAETLQDFVKLALPGRPVVLVLSATNPNGPQNTEYFFNYYRDRLPDVDLVPIYTRADGRRVTLSQTNGVLLKEGQVTNANTQYKADCLRQAGAILITGGFTENLRHLPGSDVGNAIAQAFATGTPVYTNSASVALVGGYFTWNLRSKPGASGDSLQLVNYPLLSHLEAPQKFGNSLDDVWDLVPSHFRLGFGMVAGTTAIFTPGGMTVRSPDPNGRVYVYDEELAGSQQTKIFSPGHELILHEP